MRRRLTDAPLLAVLLAMLFIASLTLLPGSPLPFRVLAETVEPWIEPGRLAFALNVLLFAPLGAIGGWWRWPPILALAVVASLSIETIQALIPGRSPNVLDLVANALGALIGYAAAASWRRRRPSSRARAQTRRSAAGDRR